MPYIAKKDRVRFGDIFKINPETVGELNYVITCLCHDFIGRKGKNYETYNAVCGVLTCAQQELYRRHIACYEDTKIIQNGDVP